MSTAIQNEIGWVTTGKYLTVVLDGKPTTVAKGTSKYKKAMQYIFKNDVDGLRTYMFPKKRIENFTNGEFTIKNGAVVDSNKQELHPELQKKIAEFSKSGKGYKAIKKFIENINLNPSENSKAQFFEFFKANNFPITHDGHILCYKYVRKNDDGNLVDSYSGNYNNNVGQIVVMDRDKCDSDRNVTCSAGLHVAAYEYANSCGSGSTIIEVKVNPKDIVSVPYDYDNQKIRCCRYEVMKVGSKKIEKSYLSQKYFLNSNNDNSENKSLESMTAKEIVDYVKNKIGKFIKINPKSKKSIIKKAKELLNETPECKETIKIISGDTAKNIIEMVKNQTGYEITLNPKSKKSIIKKAEKILIEHGLNVKVV
ncbi:MAG: hypothetical protein ACOC2U_00910 [bacterium]